MVMVFIYRIFYMYIIKCGLHLTTQPMNPWNHWATQTSTPGTPRPTLCDKCVGSLTSHRVVNIEVLWDGTYGLSSLSEKTRKSNRLQMSLQRQHFLLSYLKTLSVGPAGVRTHDLPHGSPILNQLSQPITVIQIRIFWFMDSLLLNC